MSPDRSRKTKEREDLYTRILKNGFEMDSCSNCVRRNRTCISSTDSRKCAECVRRKLSCDQMGPSHPDWVKLEREEERLDREEEETLVKLMRLRKQKKMLRSRGKEMLRRGLKTLDELDAAEEEEREENERGEQRREAEALPIPDTDVSSDPFSDLSLDPALAAALSDFDPANPFWASLGVGGGTPQASQGT